MRLVAKDKSSTRTPITKALDLANSGAFQKSPLADRNKHQNGILSSPKKAVNGESKQNEAKLTSDTMMVRASTYGDSRAVKSVEMEREDSVEVSEDEDSFYGKSTNGSFVNDNKMISKTKRVLAETRPEDEGAYGMNATSPAEEMDFRGGLKGAGARERSTSAPASDDEIPLSEDDAADQMELESDFVDDLATENSIVEGDLSVYRNKAHMRQVSASENPGTEDKYLDLDEPSELIDDMADDTGDEASSIIDGPPEIIEIYSRPVTTHANQTNADSTDNKEGNSTSSSKPGQTDSGSSSTSNSQDQGKRRRSARISAKVDEDHQQIETASYKEVGSTILAPPSQPGSRASRHSSVSASSEMDSKRATASNAEAAAFADEASTSGLLSRRKSSPKVQIRNFFLSDPPPQKSLDDDGDVVSKLRNHFKVPKPSGRSSRASSKNASRSSSVPAQDIQQTDLSTLRRLSASGISSPTASRAPENSRTPSQRMNAAPLTVRTARGLHWGPPSQTNISIPSLKVVQDKATRENLHSISSTPTTTVDSNSGISSPNQRFMTTYPVLQLPTGAPLPPATAEGNTTATTQAASHNASSSAAGAAHVAAGAESKPRPALQQIREFLRSPIPGLFCGPGDCGWVLGGVMMEFAMRELVGADIGPGDITQVEGWLDEPNIYSEWVKYAEERWLSKKNRKNPSEPTRKRSRRSSVASESGALKDGEGRPAKRARVTRETTAEAENVGSSVDGQATRSLREGTVNQRNPASVRSGPSRLSYGGKTTRQQSLDRSVSVAGSSSSASGSGTANNVSGQRRQWGKLWREAEAEWAPPEEMKALYLQKTYLNAGLYSNAYKQSTVPRARQIYAAGADFKFPLPINHGLALVETQTDFELPYDILRFVELHGGVDNVRQMTVAKKQPSPFYKIKQNIYVDRKPHKQKEAVVCQCKPSGKGDSGCGDSCLNRCMFIECSPKECPVGEQCSNQRFQKKEDVKGLEVFWTHGRGWGLRTNETINRGALVIEYRGEIISQATCIERMNTIYKDFENYYFLNYANGEVIDACRKGTEARYVNGEFCVGLFASHDIPAGEELLYDYRFDSFGPMQKCLCGSKNCRGFLGVNKKVEAPKEPKDTSNGHGKGKGHGHKNKSQKSAVKTVVRKKRKEEDFWFRRQQRALLLSQVREILKNKSFVHESKPLLIRNLLSRLEVETAAAMNTSPSSLLSAASGGTIGGGYAGAGSSTRSVGATGNGNGNGAGGSSGVRCVEGVPLGTPLTAAVIKRRKRGLDRIINELWKLKSPGEEDGGLSDAGPDYFLSDNEPDELADERSAIYMDIDENDDDMEMMEGEAVAGGSRHSPADRNDGSSGYENNVRGVRVRPRYSSASMIALDEEARPVRDRVLSRRSLPLGGSSRGPSRPASRGPSRPASRGPSRPASNAASRPASNGPSRPGSNAPSRAGSRGPSRPGSHHSSPKSRTSETDRRSRLGLSRPLESIPHQGGEVLDSGRLDEETDDEDGVRVVDSDNPEPDPYTFSLEYVQELLKKRPETDDDHNWEVHDKPVRRSGRHFSSPGTALRDAADADDENDGHYTPNMMILAKFRPKSTKAAGATASGRTSRNGSAPPTATHRFKDGREAFRHHRRIMSRLYPGDIRSKKPSQTQRSVAIQCGIVPEMQQELPPPTNGNAWNRYRGYKLLSSVDVIPVIESERSSEDEMADGDFQ
ncbi:Histone-Lysine N-Methyltransferase ash1l, partial [Quaeritorhiza haematococci]